MRSAPPPLTVVVECVEPPFNKIVSPHFTLLVWVIAPHWVRRKPVLSCVRVPGTVFHAVLGDAPSFVSEPACGST